MNCFEVEECLSEYMESGLPAFEMDRVRRHLEQCPKCAALLEAVRVTVDLCRNYPEPEMDPRLLDSILAGTTGSPAPVSLYERMRRLIIQPMLTPRFAAGAGLTALFFVLMANLMLPRISTALSSVSPSQVYAVVDQSFHRLYGQGLKAYDKKNEWEAQISYFKNRVINRLQYVIEKFDIPEEESKDPVAPERRKENPLGEKRSGLQLVPA